MNDNFKTFKIRNLGPYYNFAVTFRNKFVSSTMVAKKYIDTWKANPYWSFEGFDKQLRVYTNMDASQWHYYRARKIASKMIKGSISQKYANLKMWQNQIEEELLGLSLHKLFSRSAQSQVLQATTCIIFNNNYTRTRKQ